MNEAATTESVPWRNLRGEIVEERVIAYIENLEAVNKRRLAQLENMPNPTCYYILRIYKDGGRGQTRVIKRGLTLEQARDHCRDKETSSSTCTTATARARTRKSGPWFDTYEQAV